MYVAQTKACLLEKAHQGTHGYIMRQAVTYCQWMLASSATTSASPHAGRPIPPTFTADSKEGKVTDTLVCALSLGSAYTMSSNCSEAGLGEGLWGRGVLLLILLAGRFDVSTLAMYSS